MMKSHSKNGEICKTTPIGGNIKVYKKNLLTEGSGMKDGLHSADHSRLRGHFDETAQPIVQVDVEKYQAFLDGADMTAAQKEEFLQALWSIIVSFVELGFGVHPLQEACGKPRRSALRVPKSPSMRYAQMTPATRITRQDSAPEGRLEAKYE